MGIVHHYEPCFDSIPDDAPGRWTLLREFVSSWHNLNLPLLRDTERAASDFEYRLNRPLPESLREWIAFSQDLTAIDSFTHVMRDEFDISRLNRFSATTLMIQGEGDRYWAIRDQHFEDLDPPVDYYRRDMNTNEWCYGDVESASLTSFALSHMAYFLGTGYVRTRNVDDALIAEMASAFPVVTDFDGLLVFEMTDLIAFVRRRQKDWYTLIVARKECLPVSELPECIRRMTP